jgi:hypothetical protein
MNIREEARKVGGEEAVARIDAATAIEDKALASFMTIIDATIAGKDGMERETALAALCEATSTAFAKVATEYLVLAKEDRTTGMVMAVQSVTGNMTQAFDTLDAEAGGIKDQIVSVIGKFGKLADKEDGK